MALFAGFQHRRYLPKEGSNEIVLGWCEQFVLSVRVDLRMIKE
jgi:hypothetical protein